MNGEQEPVPHGSDLVNAAEKVNLNSTVRLDSSGVSACNFDFQRIVVFNEIAGGTAEVIIEHEGQRYRLRATRNGRLLLNK